MQFARAAAAAVRAPCLSGAARRTSRSTQLTTLTAAAASAAAGAAVAAAACASIGCDEAMATRELCERVCDRKGWDAFAYAYGSAERCLSAYVREHGAAKTRKGMYDASVSAEHVFRTLEFREAHGLDRDDAAVADAIEAEPCRQFWPFAFADNAPDGCPVVFCRLSRLSLPSIMGAFEEESLLHFFALWCEHCLRLQGDSVRRQAGAERTDGGCKGVYDVYDCTGVKWSQLLLDAKNFRGVTSRVFSLGTSHYPETLYACYGTQTSCRMRTRA